MTKYAWKPNAKYKKRANVTRLMRNHDIGTIDELRWLSVRHPDWYWDAVVRDLQIPFEHPYYPVFDSSQGIEWTRWFCGAKINITVACVDRPSDDPKFSKQTALIGEREDGAVERLTYKELAVEVNRLTNALRADGIGKGDVVAVFMPMIPQAVIAAYAIAKIGAIYLPIFSGFAPAAVAARLRDAQAVAVITADSASRRGKLVPMKAACDEAVEQSPSVKRVVVYSRLEDSIAMVAGRDIAWDEYIAPHSGEALAELTDAEDPFMLAYTSGTTGKPKGAIHVHGGFLVKIASECAYQTDIHPGEVWHWFTDMGWIMGPLSMVGAHANKATMLMYEGAPDFPDPGRLWQSAAEHNVAMLGVSPTLIRALKAKGDEWVKRHKLSKLRILASTGEPWNPEPYRWLSQVVGKGRVPIINLSGGTEVGACFLSPYPVEPIKECSLGGPSLGMDIDVFDAEGNPLRGEVGELVCKKPWPGMTRGVWNDKERYLNSYWSMYPGVWRHGDWAKIDADGQWFLYGRSDEAINVAGKRVGPAEVESILVADPEVVEAATIGVPHETKGEVVWCFWVPVDPEGEDVSQRLADEIATQLGRPFKPAKVIRVGMIPKTRSAKILRRVIRSVALGEEIQNTGAIANPEAVDILVRAIDNVKE